MKNLLRKIGYGLLGLVFSVNAGCVSNYYDSRREYLEVNDSIDMRIFAGLDLNLNFNRPVQEVKNTPERWRYIPIHHSDIHKVPESNNGVIEDDSAKPSPLFALEFFKLGLETKIRDKNRVEIYMDLAWSMAPYPKHEDSWLGDVNERNYMGAVGTDKRGRGTALTYWTTVYRPTIIPGIKCDFVFPIDNGPELILGAGIRDYGLYFENGHDRYDKLDDWKRFKLAEIREKSVYVGIRKFKEAGSNSPMALGLTLKGGVNFNEFDRENREVILEKNKTSYFVALGIELRN